MTCHPPKTVLLPIALALLGAWPASAAAATYTVSIRNMQYTPGSLQVSVGDTVTWKNDDDRDHTITAADGSFDSQRIGPGKTFSYTFQKAGTYPYACSYHPRMRGAVTVTEASGPQ